MGVTLPFDGVEPIARHHSYLAARDAAVTRASKTARYLELLEAAGSRGLTDHEMVRATGWPLSSVNSIRNGCGPLVRARTDARGVSPYGKPVTLWVRA